jgi:hypothetical protein
MYNQLFDLLLGYQGQSAFNQYRETHPSLDRASGPAIRRANLRTYLETFAGARFVLIGEAAGYAGCRFSGIPFTCEAQLIGPNPLDWARGLGLARSGTRAQPWVELSARIVWGVLGARRDCLLWNAFPWHPYGKRGPLSNRAPGSDLADGREVLRCLLSLFPGARPYAVGRVAERALADIGIDAPYMRHPSHGGASKFAAAVAALGEPSRSKET